jgi:hypothetical protein
MPGSSFKKQRQELGDSLQMLLSMEDAQRSLEDDLETIGEATPFKETRWDLKQILTSPDAQGSLEDDLRDLSADKPDSFWETIELLGW